MAFTAPTSDLDEQAVEPAGFTAPKSDLIDDTPKREQGGFTAPSSDVEDEPTAGEIVAGVGTEIGVGVGGQLAGAAIGTAILPGLGTAIGYGIGSLGSGIAGSIAAQKIEGQEDISWGRAIAAGLRCHDHIRPKCMCSVANARIICGHIHRVDTCNTTGRLPA